MIINRAFFREAIIVTFAVGVVLLSFFVIQGIGVGFSRTGGAGQEASAALLTLVLLYPMVNFGLLAALSMFIGLLVTLSRWYQDSEIVVLQACGISTISLLRPAMKFALVFFIVASVDGFVMRPWVMASIGQLESNTRSSNSTAWISGGRFSEIKGKVGTLYAETVASDGIMRGVFLNQGASGNKSERVTVARQARRGRASPESDEYLELVDGTSYLGNAGSADYQLIQFKKYRFRIQPATVIEKHRSVEALSMPELMKQNTPDNTEEFHMRLSKPAIVFVLAALALALSHSDPRRSRYFNLFVAILIFFAYMQLLVVAETLLRQGSVPAPVGLWWVHGIFAVIAAYFLWRRSIGESLIPLPQRFFT